MRKRYKFWLLINLLVLPGCQVFSEPTQQVAAQSSQVLAVPVITPKRPSLVIHSLQKADSDKADVLVKAYVASMRQMIDYSLELERIIKQLQSLHTEEFGP